MVRRSSGSQESGLLPLPCLRMDYPGMVTITSLSRYGSFSMYLQYGLMAALLWSDFSDCRNTLSLHPLHLPVLVVLVLLFA